MSIHEFDGLSDRFVEIKTCGVRVFEGDGAIHEDLVHIALACPLHDDRERVRVLPRPKAI